MKNQRLRVQRTRKGETWPPSLLLSPSCKAVGVRGCTTAGHSVPSLPWESRLLRPGGGGGQAAPPAGSHGRQSPPTMRVGTRVSARHGSPCWPLPATRSQGSRHLVRMVQETSRRPESLACALWGCTGDGSWRQRGRHLMGLGDPWTRLWAAPAGGGGSGHRARWPSWALLSV